MWVSPILLPYAITSGVRDSSWLRVGVAARGRGCAWAWLRTAKGRKKNCRKSNPDFQDHLTACGFACAFVCGFACGFILRDLLTFACAFVCAGRAGLFCAI